MSGIAGIFRFDDREVSRHELGRVGNALRAHGPDRSQVEALGNVGLVHVLMRITPEDQVERQPHRGASGAIITADLRLDNRWDMLARLNISPQEGSSWPDSRIVLAAYEKFADAVWPMLRGPFAVAIWDPKARSLTLARDPLGLNVVMWHRGEKFFAFATMPNGLFAIDGVRRELCEEKFADFLVLNHAEHDTTIYRDIFRVRPAHVLKIDANGTMTQRRYWSPRDVVPVRLKSDQEYAEGLREKLDRAVRAQMRSAHTVGCLLSGGLDSSAVAALAARALAQSNRRLTAYTGAASGDFRGAPPPGHYADERPYVDAIARAAGNIDVTYVSSDAGDDFAALEKFFIALEGPVRNPTNLGWVLAILRLARQQGRRVLLGGLHGNHTISWTGWSQTAGHLLRGRLLKAFRQWRLHYRRTPHSRWASTRSLFVEPLMPRVFHGWAGARSSRSAWQEHSPIHPQFADAMQLEKRARRTGHDFRYRMRLDERIRGLLDVDYHGDWRAAEKAFTGVEVRDPTADLDVVSYCFGVPPEQYLAEDTDRSLIRRAMWGVVPEIVLTNRLHGMQSPDWREKLEQSRDKIAIEIDALSQSPLTRRLIDLPRLERALINWPSDGWDRPETFTEYNIALMRGVSGGRFLRWLEQAN